MSTTGPPPDLAGLVQLAQRGDRAAFATLYADFAAVVHGILLARCGAGEADDLTQELFMRAFEQLPELREPAAFPGWLCAAARNASIDHLRARRRHPRTSADALPELSDRGATPVEAATNRDLAAAVLACVRKLPEAYRETLVLRLVEGLSGPQIADRTGLTHGSVRVNLTRGMALLRPILAEAGLP
ncbi:MAG: sigma-70 family RNA polymerase sigma factor [Planctomycetes bacterium]|nr:sigma-70 family RNA polymerase sigma factor [Planctomycetota bacterium]